MTSIRFLGYLIAVMTLSLAHPELFPVLSLISSVFGYALLWWTGKDVSSPWARRWLLFSAFLIIQGVHFSWLARPEYHGKPILVLYGILTIFYALILTMLSLAVIRKGNSPLRLAAIAAWFMLFEWGMMHFLCGFTIDQLGLHLLWHPVGAQISAFFGGLSLTFLVLFTNMLLFLSFEKKNLRKCVFFVMLFPYLFGIPHYFLKERAIQKASSITAGLVQTGLRPEEKRLIPKDYTKFIPIDQQWQNILLHAKELKQAKLLDLAILPEAALPFGSTAPVIPLEVAGEMIREKLGFLPDAGGHVVETYLGPYATNSYLLSALSRYLNAIVITGLLHEEGEKNYTSAFAFYPDKRRAERYDKRLLVPVAEGAPFTFMQEISKKYGIVEYFTSGTQYQPFSGPIEIMPNICYEEMRGDILRRTSANPQLFVNLTNDVWYPNSTLPERHYAHAKLRAIENGVPYIRSCNTGVTAAIAPSGREIVRVKDKNGSTEWVQGTAIAKLPALSYQTPYGKYGDTPLLLLGVMLIVLDLLLQYKAYLRLKKIMSMKQPTT